MTELLKLHREAKTPSFVCRICHEQGFAEFVYQRMGACGRCVRALVNEYSLAHSGEPDRVYFCSQEDGGTA